MRVGLLWNDHSSRNKKKKMRELNGKACLLGYVVSTEISWNLIPRSMTRHEKANQHTLSHIRLFAE